MEIEEHKNEVQMESQKASEEISGADSKPETHSELNLEKPAKRIRRQATEEQLNNPLHGVKLKEILERLVEYYGWDYLADRVNIRCFMYDPTMKSSLGFLRRTEWARDHVKDIYLEMVEEKKLDLAESENDSES